MSGTEKHTLLLALLGTLAFSLNAQIQDAAPPQAPASVEAGNGEAQRPLKIGAGVTPPKIISAPEPEYPPSARELGYGGTCVLSIVVGPDGKPRDIRISRSIGLGLDESAIDAVQKWRFEPAKKNGKPVAVEIRVEVNFRLSGGDRKIADLMKKAEQGDADAQLKASSFYFRSEFRADQDRAMKLLTQAANQGFGKAQFQLAERTYRHPTENFTDYVNAYMWYTLARHGGEKKADKPLKELTSKMTPEQLAEAQARVANWKPTLSK